MHCLSALTSSHSVMLVVCCSLILLKSIVSCSFIIVLFGYSITLLLSIVFLLPTVSCTSIAYFSSMFLP